MELVTKQKVKALFSPALTGKTTYTADEILLTLQTMPTVDAELVRHGHWVENNGRYGWYCSQCKKENNYAYHYNENNAIELQDHYCPYCGAKMGGEGRENETR